MVLNSDKCCCYVSVIDGQIGAQLWLVFFTVILHLGVTPKYFSLFCTCAQESQVLVLIMHPLAKIVFQQIHVNIYNYLIFALRVLPIHQQIIFLLLLRTLPACYCIHSRYTNFYYLQQFLIHAAHITCTATLPFATLMLHWPFMFPMPATCHSWVSTIVWATIKKQGKTILLVFGLVSVRLKKPHQH